MSVYIHKGAGGEAVVEQVRGDSVRKARADTLRHLNPECPVLRTSMRRDVQMARTSNTMALRERTSKCWHAGCWDDVSTQPSVEKLAKPRSAKQGAKSTVKQPSRTKRATERAGKSA